VAGRSRKAVEMGLCSKMMHEWVDGSRTCVPCRKMNVAKRRGGYKYGPDGRSLEERFFSRVRASHPMGCWTWTGATNERGYGRFGFGPRGSITHVSAHRWVYEFMIAPIPEGLEIDHLCRNPSCVNPYHLEPVPAQENLRRRELTDEEHFALMT